YRQPGSQSTKAGSKTGSAFRRCGAAAGRNVDDIRRGEVWWVDLAAEPRGSEPGYRRPVVVIQDDYFNRSALATVVVVAVTRNMTLAALPGNVVVSPRETGLKRECVANVTAVITVDRRFFADPGYPLGALSRSTMDLIDKGLALVLSL